MALKPSNARSRTSRMDSIASRRSASSVTVFLPHLAVFMTSVSARVYCVLGPCARPRAFVAVVAAVCAAAPCQWRAGSSFRAKIGVSRMFWNVRISLCCLAHADDTRRTTRHDEARRMRKNEGRLSGRGSGGQEEAPMRKKKRKKEGIKRPTSSGAQVAATTTHGKRKDTRWCALELEGRARRGV